VAGQDLFLLGSPFVPKTQFSLTGGNTLTVLAPGTDDKHIYVKSVRFNGRELPGFRISAKELLAGGTLEFTMAEKA
jgi:putative alpha-1,2-mannosidase